MNYLRPNLSYVVLNPLYSGVNTHLGCYSTSIDLVKIESAYEITIFGLKMMMKSGLEIFILKSLHGGRRLFLLLNL